MTLSTDELVAAAEKIKALGASAPIDGRDPINQPMINNWVEAMGDGNPIYVDENAARAAGFDGVVSPPAMTQVWTMRGLHGERADDDPTSQIFELLDDAGYTSVVATNCDTTYHRYTTPGEEVSISSALTELTGPKTTGLGEGWFFTIRNTWSVGTEVVAEMDFRMLKFAPKTAAAQPDPATSYDDLDPSKMMRPNSSRDSAFFWEGVAAHELRIQQREDGSLQHPPVPALWKDKTEQTDYILAAGTGTVYSFVVHHAPQVPGRSLPFVIALVELDLDASLRSAGPGVRMLGELRGVDPSTVAIGQRVQVEFLDFPADSRGDAWSLYAWQRIDESKGIEGDK
ncbi:bifunctional MaoC family dehydratase N-terminal/OB-fold nucleic acid binding domain-containing protein [Jongsikchunia kroppenstedtii]|uniref:bifunctional MaoC family dehydratase N-terminal/OB-fold nucleic acid binding domain-containing protein n=1 Tax=Jongsikchunia kroppenstedtii TaxID=1121721 RepID=UPI0003622DB3|nr:MaoC family dehydratase N-terminal domain-containing protein [Jongsikchunia kroppenstedtii]